MDKEKRIELLLKARNLLHKQENGQKLTGNEIIIAHDYVDMVIDDMINPEMKIFRVTFMYGQEVYSAHSAQELCIYLNQHKEDLWIYDPVSLEDIEEVELSSSNRINYLGGHRE